MPKYFCEYCGIYLTHSNPRGRYQHSHGRKHIKNKLEYYSQFLSENPENTNEQVLAITSKIYKGLQQIPEMSQIQEQNETANIQRMPQMAQQLPEQFNQVNMPIYPS